MTNSRGSSEDGRFQDSIAEVQMLAQRGQHQEASELCQALIRERPDSGPAHAAMGDVCAAEGRWNDAVDWYEQALNLSFDPAVMEKLAAARSRALRSGAPEAQPGPAPAPARAAEGERGVSPQVVGLVVIGVLLITLLAFFLSRGLSRPSETTTVEPSRVEARPVAPGPPPAPVPTPGPSAEYPPAVVSSAPTPLPQTTRQQPAATPTPRRPPRQARLTPTTEAVSSREQRVLDQVHFVRLEAAGSARLPAAMALDDYSGVGILTFRIPLPDNLAGLEQEITIAAFRAALAAMRADAALNTLVVRYIARTPGELEDEEDAVIFRATALRDRLQPWMDRTDIPDFQQLRTNVLTDVWLNQAALERHAQSRNAARSGAPPR